jgi:hypothetical protein
MPGGAQGTFGGPACSAGRQARPDRTGRRTRRSVIWFVSRSDSGRARRFAAPAECSPPVALDLLSSCCSSPAVLHLKTGPSGRERQEGQEG